MRGIESTKTLKIKNLIHYVRVNFLRIQGHNRMKKNF